MIILPPGVHLTKRQCELCVLHAQALSQKEIAYRLCLSPRSVKTYFATIYRKLGVSNGLELLRWWVDRVERDYQSAGDIPLFDVAA